MVTQRTAFLLMLSMAIATQPLLAAGVPDRVNYQGVLRDNSDEPLDGNFDMIFRFFDDPVAGDELLIDEHLAAGTGDVTVTGGLFNVALGSGTVLDGSGPGVFNDLREVFADKEAVWLEIQVGGETLSPRVGVLSAAYSMNTKALEGKAADQFIDISATPQEKTGLLTASGGVDYGPGPDDDLTAADVNTLTSGALADALHSHNLVGNAGDSDLLDGIDSTQFLRSDASDTFTTGTLTVAAGTVLDVDGETRLDGTLFMDHDGPDGTQTVNFFDNGNPADEFLMWDETQDRFRLSNTIKVQGDGQFVGNSLFVNIEGPDGSSGINFYNNAEPTGASIQWDDVSGRFDISDELFVRGDVRLTGGGVYLDDDGPDATQRLYFFEGGSATGRSLSWDDPQARFELNDSLAMSGTLRVGSTVGAPTGYSHFGNLGSPDSGDITNTNDVYVSNDLEADGTLYLGGTIQMKDSGSDSDQTIFFLDNASPTDESISWRNTGDRFEVSNDLRVQGALSAGGFDDTITSYNRFGSDGVVQADFINNSQDLFVNSDFRVRNHAAMLYLHAGAAVPQAAWTYNTIGNPSQLAPEITNEFDLFISNDLQVGSGVAYFDGDIRMQDAPGDTDQFIYFNDGGNSTANYIEWDDSMSVGVSCEAGTVDSGFRWSIADNSASGWAFQNGSDIEALIDELGDVVIDGSLTQSGSCDVAENFLGAEDLEAGTVVVLDPDVPEGVHISATAYDPTVIGVVSTRPGILLQGPTADSYAVWNDLENVRHQLRSMGAVRTVGGGTLEVAGAQLPAREALEVRAAQLEASLDSWTRGNVPVALVGRVPVKVDASTRPIVKGDYLTTSDIPGHAMALDRPGPYFGIAMGELGSGRGDMLVFLTQGWYGGDGAVTGAESTAAPAEEIAATQQMEADLQIVLDRDANDQSRFSIFRNGEDGLRDEVFRVDELGNVWARGSFRPSAMDLAEYHPVTEPVGVGDVLVADRENPGRLRRGSMAADPAVVGVVSTEPGVLMGAGFTRIAEADPELALELDRARDAEDRDEEARLWRELEKKFSATHAALALSGTVPCKVDAGYGSIEVGDLLTVSPTAGHAMRADDPQPGTILGKALEPLDSGTGVIRILVMLR